jgi:ferredoxin
MSATAIAAGAAIAKAQRAVPQNWTAKRDGGFAPIVPKEVPARTRPITPPGSISAKHFAKHCTACQLCVSTCPNNVLRPSTSFDNFMQPYMSYERGYCRPECVDCSQVCPAGAIHPITAEEKTGIQIGLAVWVKERCIVNRDNVQCDNCHRHCPTEAIQMVPIDASDEKSLKIPVINDAKCIGCGACEGLCPSNPLSAIYVNGVDVHIPI